MLRCLYDSTKSTVIKGENKKHPECLCLTFGVQFTMGAFFETIPDIQNPAHLVKARKMSTSRGSCPEIIHLIGCKVVNLRFSVLIYADVNDTGNIGNAHVYISLRVTGL